MVRVAVNEVDWSNPPSRIGYISFKIPPHTVITIIALQDAINKMLIDLSAIVGLDGVPLHFQLFPKLWLDIYSSRWKQ